MKVWLAYKFSGSDLKKPVVYYSLSNLSLAFPNNEILGEADFLMF